jgi:hypothetical protein
MLNIRVTSFLNPILIRMREGSIKLVKGESEMASTAKATVARYVEPSRKGARNRVLMRGTVYTPEGACMVWIRDISAKGALVAGDDPLPSDCDVIFKRGQIFAAGRIAWSNETGAGLTFYRDLADCDVAAASLPLPHRDD